MFCWKYVSSVVAVTCSALAKMWVEGSVQTGILRSSQPRSVAQDRRGAEQARPEHPGGRRVHGRLRRQGVGDEPGAPAEVDVMIEALDVALLAERCSHRRPAVEADEIAQLPEDRGGHPILRVAQRVHHDGAQAGKYAREAEELPLRADQALDVLGDQ